MADAVPESFSDVVASYVDCASEDLRAAFEQVTHIERAAHFSKVTLVAALCDVDSENQTQLFLNLQMATGLSRCQ
jgi:hypothetical protein